MDEQKIQSIRKERKELSEKILKLKQDICELENSIPYKSYNIKSEYTQTEYVFASICFGLCAVLVEFIGGLIGHMGNNVLLGLMLFLPFAAVPATGAVYSLVKAVKSKQGKNKKINNDIQLRRELNLKEEELEKLEAYDHDLYTQLIQELSKLEDITVKNFNKYKLTTDNSSWVVDEYEDIKEV